MEVMMEALTNGGREQRIQAALALSSLTSKQKHKFVEKGMISTLVSMINTCDYEAIEAALLALLSLAYGSERFRNSKLHCLIISICIPALLAVLTCQSQTLLELAIAILLILSSCATNRLAIASSGAIPILVELLSGGDQQSNIISIQGKLDTVATLQNLSTCNQILPSLASSQATIYLLQILHDSDKSSELVEKATALLEKIITSSDAALRITASTGGALQALVETVEDGTPQCKEHAVGILHRICQTCREEYRLMMLREGVMPGLLQLSVDGTRRSRTLSRTLLLLLRDSSGSSGSSRQQLEKNEILEQMMARIDSEEDGYNGTTLRMVEQMIAKLSA